MEGFEWMIFMSFKNGGVDSRWTFTATIYGCGNKNSTSLLND